MKLIWGDSADVSLETMADGRFLGLRPGPLLGLPLRLGGFSDPPSYSGPTSSAPASPGPPATPGGRVERVGALYVKINGEVWRCLDQDTQDDAIVKMA